VVVRDTVTLRDTVEVVKRVTRRVVVRDTPDVYKFAYNFWSSYWMAEYADEKRVLKGVDSLSVSVSLNENIKKLITEERAKTRLELTLRQFNIRIRDQATHSLNLSIDGLKDDDDLLIYTISISLLERVRFSREGVLFTRYAPLWEQGSFGYAGKTVAKDALLEALRTKGESFVNEYLGANPK
jgi:hypothetical protein